jgi:REP element-mobilizing transposase RayT
VFHDLARRRECRIEEGHLMPDHVHMPVSIPPKYSVAEVSRAKARFGSHRMSNEKRNILLGISSGRAAITFRRWAGTSFGP